MEERELTCRRCNKQFKHQAQKKQYCSNCCQQKKKELNQSAYQNKKSLYLDTKVVCVCQPNHGFRLLKINFDFSHLGSSPTTWSELE
jgi:ribosomal protein L37E